MIAAIIMMFLQVETKFLPQWVRHDTTPARIICFCVIEHNLLLMSDDPKWFDNFIQWAAVKCNLRERERDCPGRPARSYLPGNL